MPRQSAPEAEQAITTVLKARDAKTSQCIMGASMAGATVFCSIVQVMAARQALRYWAVSTAASTAMKAQIPNRMTRCLERDDSSLNWGPFGPGGLDGRVLYSDEDGLPGLAPGVETDRADSSSASAAASCMTESIITPTLAYKEGRSKVHES